MFRKKLAELKNHGLQEEDIAYFVKDLNSFKAQVQISPDVASGVVCVADAHKRTENISVVDKWNEAAMVSRMEGLAGQPEGLFSWL